MICNCVFRDWIFGILTYIYRTSVDEGKNRNPIFVPRKEVLEFPEDDIEANKVLTKVPSSYDGHSEELIWQFSAHKDQVPILAICGRYRSDRNVQIFRKVPQKGEYVVDTKSFLPTRRQNVRLNLRFIHPFKPANVANRQSEEVSKKQDGETKKREASTAQKPASSSTPNERNRQLVYSFLMGHATKSEKDTMSTLVVRMDNEGVFQSMHKVYVQNKMLNITYMPFPDQLLLLNSIQLSEVTSQNDNTEKYKTVQCSQQTKSKLKEFIKSKQGPATTAKKTDDTRRKPKREHEKDNFNVEDNLDKRPRMKGPKQQADTTAISETTLKEEGEKQRNDIHNKYETTLETVKDNEADDPSKKSDTTSNRESDKKTNDPSKKSDMTLNREGESKTDDDGLNSQITSDRNGEKKTSDNGLNSQMTSDREGEKKTDDNGLNSRMTSNREGERKTNDNGLNSKMTSNRERDKKTDDNGVNSEMTSNTDGEKKTNDTRDYSEMTSNRNGEQKTEDTRDYSEMTSNRNGEQKTDETRDYSEMILDKEGQKQTDDTRDYSEIALDREGHKVADDTRDYSDMTSGREDKKQPDDTRDYSDMTSGREDKKRPDHTKDYSEKTLDRECDTETDANGVKSKTSSKIGPNQTDVKPDYIGDEPNTPDSETEIEFNSKKHLQSYESDDDMFSQEENTNQIVGNTDPGKREMQWNKDYSQKVGDEEIYTEANRTSALIDVSYYQQLPSNDTAIYTMSTTTMNTEATNFQSLPTNATALSAISTATMNTEATNYHSLPSNATAVSAMSTATMNVEGTNSQLLPSNATAVSAMSTAMDLHGTNSQSLPTNATAMSTMNTTMDLQASNYQPPELPGINPLFDLNYTDTLLTNYGVQSTSNTIANANTILYGMSHAQSNSSFTDSNRNYINEGSQGLSNWQIPASNFQSSQEFNLGNRIKITISVPPKDLQPHSRIPLDLTIETKMPIEVSEQRPNQRTQTNINPELTNEDCESVDIQSSTSSKPWRSYKSTTTSDTIKKKTETDEEKTQSASENDANSKPYDINLHKHGNYSFTKRPNDKVYGVGKSRYRNEINRVAPTMGIQKRENETSSNSTHKKTAMKPRNKQLQSKIGLEDDRRFKATTMNDVSFKSRRKELMSNEETKIDGKLGTMEGYESNSPVDTKGKKEEEDCAPKKYRQTNNGDDEKLQKIRGVHNHVQDEMDEEHLEKSNDYEDGEIEDEGNRLEEYENEEESEEQSETSDINPDENYLQGEDDDDKPQFTSTPKGTINTFGKNIKFYSI